MNVAIHYEPGNNFSEYWKSYLDESKIAYKIVNAYQSDIIQQLEGCKYFLWHINNLNHRDQIFAKYLMNAVEGIGVKVFPNYDTNWHFDDKVAQKYLFESFNLPLVNSTVFYNKKEALGWVNQTTFPRVFKLRKGSGSKGVQLARSKREAKKLINIAFGKGFKTISTWFMFTERMRKYRNNQDTLVGVLKGFVRLSIGTEYINMSNNEKGYVYFQDFIPNNSFDIRVIVIGNKAFGIKRMNRKDDFRASGSGYIIYDKNQIDKKCVRLAFEANKKLNMQCAALDFVYDENNTPLIVEVSYGYNPKGYRACEGYWDENLTWYPCVITPEIWMIENLIKERALA
jgi:glutathione synthase/RimK-type ligase-like ATP-grasp enzyme